MKRARRLTVAAIVLAMAGAATACGGNPVNPTGQAGSSSPSHNGHGQFVPPSPAPLRAGERFVTLTMAQPYSPSAPNGGTDEYRCFLVDPELTTGAYLTGSQFLPQNADLVHHAIFFRIKPEDVAKAHEADQRAPGEGWQCFSGSGIDGDDAWVAHWAPGANEVLLDAGLGYELPPGSRLVMQVHYNLLAAKGSAGGTDQSSIRLRVAEGKSLTALETFQVAAPVELPCTAQESGPLCDRNAAVEDVTKRFGEEVGRMSERLLRWCSNEKPVPGATQQCDIPMEGAATIHAVAGHMHLLGRSIKMEINPGTPQANTILDIPAYNFDDQAIRPLAAPVQLNKGDIVRVTCTHDAGLRKLIPQLQPLPPRYVVWGDGTSDEMCLGLLIGALKA
ncbi:monooxygenase [Allorhizocola rhizosphaerae]|uniref:monooxygenase n=1 Tax=Allorhizocola rhizosphaerae TaxID=1872709 RepID=UPI000E3BEB8B|nr:monooxygenase [Allorhizocola rhizosphaerae]